MDPNGISDSSGGGGGGDDDTIRVVIVCTLFVLVSIAMVIYIFNKFCKCFFYTKRNAAGSARRWCFFGLKDSRTPQSDTNSPTAAAVNNSVMANPECAQIVIDDSSPSRDAGQIQQQQQIVAIPPSPAATTIATSSSRSATNNAPPQQQPAPSATEHTYLLDRAQRTLHGPRMIGLPGLLTGCSINTHPQQEDAALPPDGTVNTSAQGVTFV